MDTTFAVSIINLVVVGILTLYGKNYLTSYFSEKGKNLASKEDIHVITNRVESIKSQYTGEIERLKSDLQAESTFLQKRRQVYEEIAGALRVFISGHQQDQNAKEKFLQAYATAWLWAPDTVLKSLNAFLKKQVLNTQQPGSIPQADMKALYASCIVEMRKDAGFPLTQVPTTEFQFVSF